MNLTPLSQTLIPQNALPHTPLHNQMERAEKFIHFLFLIYE